MADEIISNLLVVVLDANPVWWGRIAREGNQSDGHDQQITLTHCVDSLMVLCNAHLMMKHNNCLSFIVSHTSTSKFVFPKENSIGDVSNDQKDLPSDGKYEGFAEVNDAIITELKNLLSTEDSKAGGHSSEVPPTLLASALTMALCFGHSLFPQQSYLLTFIQYLHQQRQNLYKRGGPAVEQLMELCVSGSTRKPFISLGLEHYLTLALLQQIFTEQKKNAQKLKSRILILKAAPDVSTQYMPIMNCIFAAQKSNTVIDACVLDEHSGFLQQAADITGGMYLEVPQTLALLQYLLWVFLPEPQVREQLVLPSSMHIDYRAACFCHRRLVDIGFVCSVCLSIYCQFIPLCLTCQTRFKLPALPMARPKKKKKENTAPPK